MFLLTKNHGLEVNLSPRSGFSKSGAFTIGAPRAVLVKGLRGSLGLSKKYEATYIFFKFFSESIAWLEKSKSGEISDVLVLKVGD